MKEKFVLVSGAHCKQGRRDECLRRYVVVSFLRNPRWTWPAVGFLFIFLFPSLLDSGVRATFFFFGGGGVLEARTKRGESV